MRFFFKVLLLKHFHRSGCDRRKVRSPAVSVGVGAALSIFLWSCVFKTPAIYVLFCDISVLVLRFASDIPHLNTDQASSHLRSPGKCAVFIPWLWIPLGSRHQSLRSNCKDMAFLVEMKCKPFPCRAGKFWRGLSNGERFFAFPLVASGHPHGSCWNSSINIMAGLPFLWFSLA